jgi:hypothetical protein
MLMHDYTARLFMYQAEYFGLALDWRLTGFKRYKI